MAPLPPRRRRRDPRPWRPIIVRCGTRKETLMSIYEPTRNPLIINRRRLMSFLAGAVAAGIVTRSEALAYLQDASEKTGVTAEEWNPETINALAGTTEVDTAAQLHALIPETTEGTVQYWDVEPNQADPEISHEMYRAFPEAFAGYYPN